MSIIVRICWFVTALMATAGLITGCAGGPVGWGGTDEVLFASADTIKIQWDSLTTTEDAVRAKAQAHCGARSIVVVDATSDVATPGLTRSKTWRCMSAKAADPPGAARAAQTPPSLYQPQQLDRPAAPKAAAGQDLYQAEQFARTQNCGAAPKATMAAKGPGFETYSLPCPNGNTIMVRCEFGNCRVLR